MIDMKREIEKFGKLCCKTQEELKKYLTAYLSSNGYKVVVGDGFIYAKGELPYLVTAHMDTVHKVQCKRYSIHSFKGKHRIQSKDGIGGDDRCGCYMITRIVADGYKPSVLFCEDEEIGCVGSEKFCKTKHIKDLEKLNYLIELDRANNNDAVFYDCDNKEFTKFILDNTGYKEAIGSYTDIVELSDECEIASVNFSCGYYNAHTTSEYVIFEEMQNTIKIVEKLLRMEDCKQYEFIRAKRNDRYFLSDSYYDDLYDKYYYSSYYESKKEISGMEINFNDPQTAKEEIAYIPGENEAECMYNFFYMYPDVCWNNIIDYLFV